MSDDAPTDPTGATVPTNATGAAPPSRVQLAILWVVFAVLSAYPLFEGISNLIAVPPYYASVGLGGSVPWALLVVGVAAPVFLYAAACLLGRGRPLFPRALILAVGLASANALTLSVIAWAGASLAATL